MNSSKPVKQLFDLTDRVAIVTGGAGMLGEKHAEVIAEFGGIPILLDIDRKEGNEKARKISKKYKVNCEYIFCNITKESSIKSVRDDIINQYGHIDILINNAAIDPKVKAKSGENLSRLENFSIDQWNLELNVGLTGVMLCSKFFGYEMAKNGKGVIVNISSDLGVISPDQRIYKIDGIPDNKQVVKPITYSVIKHGLIGITKYLSTYWVNENVRCNALSPGGIYAGQSEDFVKKLVDLIPMGRMANINDYKAAVAFLVSDASSYMTGANLVVDGGRSIW